MIRKKVTDAYLTADGELDIIAGRADTPAARKAVRNINSIRDLWLLAKKAKEANPDPVLAEIHMICDRIRRIPDVGYQFEWQGYNAIYFLRRRTDGAIRIAFPKIGTVTPDRSIVDEVNDMVPGAKITTIDNEYWAVYDHFAIDARDIPAIVDHMLRQLRRATELLHRLTACQ